MRLFSLKKVEQENSNKKETNKTKITKRKIRRNRFGFPVYY